MNTRRPQYGIDMSAATAAPLWLALSLLVSASEAKISLTAAQGETIVLPCQTPSDYPILAVEWDRPDLEPQYVILYRDEQSDPENQYESFKHRVRLDRHQIKTGDVSLILRNVTTDDQGIYKCRVIQRGMRRQKRASLNIEPIQVIKLSVHQSGLEDGGSEDGGEAGGNNNVALVAGLSFAVIAVVIASASVTILARNLRRKKNNPPPDNEASEQLKKTCEL
ncbi:coxsackievirus and adenovirus receptor homolog [Xiphias gladius]|uniref:coxsackievirus and adenovirus receptor homolog n=1 Tax=Xiphias gladius TaxID=8245 RepID=UPI001A985076|nr:coxsackievirus and adenovirus receptor homolog [Xiphias gladius]